MGVLTSKVDPDDVAQETFVAFFEMAKRGEIRWKKNGDLWRLLAGIAANKTKQKFDFYNTAKREFKSESYLEDTFKEIADHASSTTELVELVEDLFATQKPLVRSLIELRLAGYSNSEIGEQIGRSSRTVRRIIESLQAELLSGHGLGFGFLHSVNADKPHIESQNSTIQNPNPGITKANDNLLDYKDFQLLKMIGQGSFAKVYLAKQIATGEMFALKSLRKKWFSNFTARTAFTNEARLLNQLNEPNIVKFYGAGVLPNQSHFLLLEFVEGKPILEAAREADPELVAGWLKSLETTIQKFHESGISHGDLRSPNILINRQGQIRIIDFGLARFTGESNSQSSAPTIADDLRAIHDLRKCLTQKQLHLNNRPPHLDRTF